MSASYDGKYLQNRGESVSVINHVSEVRLRMIVFEDVLPTFIYMRRIQLSEMMKCIELPKLTEPYSGRRIY